MNKSSPTSPSDGKDIRPFSACEICWGISKKVNIETTMKVVEPDGLKVRLCKEHCEMMQLEFAR